MCMCVYYTHTHTHTYPSLSRSRRTDWRGATALIARGRECGDTKHVRSRQQPTGEWNGEWSSRARRTPSPSLPTIVTIAITAIAARWRWPLSLPRVWPAIRLPSAALAIVATWFLPVRAVREKETTFFIDLNFKEPKPVLERDVKSKQTTSKEAEYDISNRMPVFFLLHKIFQNRYTAESISREKMFHKII